MVAAGRGGLSIRSPGRMPHVASAAKPSRTSTSIVAAWAPAENPTIAAPPIAAATRACWVPAPPGVTGTAEASSCNERTTGATASAAGTWNA